MAGRGRESTQPMAMEASAFDTLCIPGTFREKVPSFSPRKKQSKVGWPKPVKDDGGGGVICGSIQAVSYYLTGQPFGYLLVLGRVRIDDQGSVFGKQLGKLPERAADILDIFEKVQMVSIHVEDQADLREKTQGNCWYTRRLL